MGLSQQETCGFFLILIMDPDGDGAKYWQPEKLGILFKEALKIQ